MSAPAPEPKCLPGCDEQHTEECPVPEWEAAYWYRYFGLRKGMTQAERVRQLEAFQPPGNTWRLDGEES